MTPQDYATTSQISSPRWSPDGTRIVYVVTRADLEGSAYHSDLWLIDADGANNRALTHAACADASPRWARCGQRIAYLSDSDGLTAIHLLDLRGSDTKRLTNEPTAIHAIEWSPDSRYLAFTRADEPHPDWMARQQVRDDARVCGENTRHVHLHLLDVESGRVQRLTSGAFSIFTFDWSPDSARIVFDCGAGTGLDALYSADLVAVTIENGALQPLSVRPGADRSPRHSPDGKWVAFLSSGGKKDWLVEQGIYVMPSGGGEVRYLTAAYDRSPEGLQWSEDSQWILFEGPWNMASSLFRVAVDGNGFERLTAYDGVVEAVHVHAGRSVSVRQSLTEPPELFVDERRVTSHHGSSSTPIVETHRLGETRIVRWKNAHDGLEIEGLLTLPPHHDGATRLPLLTFIHGGPASRFDLAYTGYLGHAYAPQALAARGFAVLRPNIRGTGGYGERFRQKMRNEWTTLPWLDVESGIDALIDEGIVDAARLGLMGWSFGGFLAAWGLGQSTRFKAVSIGAPVVDLLTMHLTSDIRDYLPSYFPDMSLDELRAQSPLWSLKRTNAKVLIQHGELDERVPLAQGMMLYRRLQELGVDVSMVVYPRTAHVAREPRLRIDVATRNVEFFSRWLMGEAEVETGKLKVES